MYLCVGVCLFVCMCLLCLVFVHVGVCVRVMSLLYLIASQQRSLSGNNISYQPIVYNLINTTTHTHTHIFTHTYTHTDLHTNTLLNVIIINNITRN